MIHNLTTIRYFHMVALLLLLGCDGHLGVRGRAYEWVQPDLNAKSYVYIDSIDSTPPPQLIPLKKAEIVIEPWTSEGKAKVENPELFIIKTITDENGYFESGITTAPGEFDATFKAHSPGFMPIEQVFKHDRFWHNVIVVLVREKNKEK
jgi:hypothetical protein